MSNILGLSGKKSSGKTTTANWIIGQQMVASGLVDYARIDKLGRLVVPAVLEDGKISEGVFDPTSKHPEIVAMLSKYVWPAVKLYSFADILKESISKIFSIPMNQLNGTNDEKNMPTQYTYAQWAPFMSAKQKKRVREEFLRDKYISGREIMQVFGTDICRAIHQDVWVDACISLIKQEKSDLAIVTDLRFPNEVVGIQEVGGKVMRFTRAPFAGEDQHESETALDDYPVEKYDCLMDNKDSSIQEQNERTNAILVAWKFNTWDFTVRNI